MWTDGWTDSRQVNHTRFSKMCEAPDLVHFVIYKKQSQETDLRLLELMGQCLRIK
jgi:hypothetical protein